MCSAFSDIEAAVPHLNSSAASQKARFSPAVKNNCLKMKILLFTQPHFVSQPYDIIKYVTLDHKTSQK